PASCETVCTVSVLGFLFGARGLRRLERAPDRAVPVLPQHGQRLASGLSQFELDFDVSFSRDRKKSVVRDVDRVLGVLKQWQTEHLNRFAREQVGGVIQILIAPRPQRDNLRELCRRDSGSGLGLEYKLIA